MMDDNEKKPEAKQSVGSQNADEAKNRVDAAKNKEGNSSGLLNTLAANAAENNASSSSVVTNANLDVATNFASFQQALTSCLSKFSNLAKYISAQLGDQMQSIVDSMNLPELYESFKNLSTTMKLLVVIVLLALLALLRYLTWEAVSYFWPYIEQFLKSEHVKTFLEHGTEFLQDLSKSSLISQFDTIFKTAADQKAETDADENDAEDGNYEEPPCFEIGMWKKLTSKGSNWLVSFINTLFAWFSSCVMKQAKK